jgi:hypothetical protein
MYDTQAESMGRHHPSLVKIGDFMNVITSFKKN